MGSVNLCTSGYILTVVCDGHRDDVAQNMLLLEYSTQYVVPLDRRCRFSPLDVKDCTRTEASLNATVELMTSRCLHGGLSQENVSPDVSPT